MKQHQHRWAAYVIALARGTAVVGAILLGSSVQGRGNDAPFSQLIVFGDSLSDTGNFHQLSGGIPPAPYSDGRFSNGALWIEHLAADLGMEPSGEGNYAVAGATTGSLNSNNGIAGRTYPGLQQQIAAFEAAVQPGTADPNALYVIWIGSNDFFVTLALGGDPGALIHDGVTQTLEALQVLGGLGARHVLVVNIPDLGLTPYGQGSGFGPLITHLCSLYNAALDLALDSLHQAGLPTIRVDSFTSLQDMVNFPDEFGFSNVTVPYLVGGTGDQNAFLFWDAVHPTTHGHRVLADAARVQLLDAFSPRQGDGAPPAAVNALNGLVRAGKP